MNHPRMQILIVDDQNGIRRTMTGIIENLGFQVVDVEDGYQAIDRIKNTRFDLVFLDIKMPGINGVQTFREIKKLRPDSLVVMMTGFDVAELIDASFDEGAICVVYKPFDSEQIVDVVRSAHQSCLAKFPTNIGALVGEIQHEIDSIITESPIARVTVWIPDGELRALRLLAVSGPAADQPQILCSSASLGGIAFYANEAQVINDYQSHPLKSEPDIGLGIKSALAVPIRADSDRTLGSVAVYCYEADYFDAEVVDRFCRLAQGVGNLIETTSAAEAEFLHGLRGARISTAQTLVDVSR